MKKYFLHFAVLFSLFAVRIANANQLRVMTFNVMCSFCGHTVESGKFKQRMKGVAQTINMHRPDLISLQELVNGRGNLDKILPFLDQPYISVFEKGVFGTYGDPTLLILKSRFIVLKQGGFWLGPISPHFNLGWHVGFPRRVQWADLQEISTGFVFKFVGAHFDDADKNKDRSAELLIKRMQDVIMPIVFAGDTNLNPDKRGYEILTEHFRDTFSGVQNHFYYGESRYANSDGCNLSTDAVFPDCRIDHVLLSPNAPWSTKTWGVDVTKYFGTTGFLSDHRAVIVDLSD